MLKGLSGAKWRATHQASVDGMLHDLNVRRPVKSFGSEFSNRDRWTGRGLFTAMNNRYYDGSWPLERILREANAEIPFQPHIVIAATPDDLPAGTALALVGGAYHEAWHTRYSRRTTLKREEIEAPLNERWGKADVKFWKFQHGVMLTWSNIIEDIRIERLGCARFPGALPKMEALQDLILKMEQEGFEKQMPELAFDHDRLRLSGHRAWLRHAAPANRARFLRAGLSRGGRFREWAAASDARQGDQPARVG